MDAQKHKAKQALRRKYRVRRKTRGTANKPRLSVFRSNLHIYAQLIDDDQQITLAAASSVEKAANLQYGGNVAAAMTVGKLLAEKAKAKGITVATFDRGSYRFHGRVKALARAATEAGLICTGLVDEPKKKRETTVADAKSKAKSDGKKKPAKA
jgi:large subunit ribosomal protein L18